MNRLLLVAGSGRSGTSLVSALIGKLGFHIPQPEVQPDDTNPRGFGEPQWAVDFHNRLLRDANVQTSDARPSAWAATAEACLEEENLEVVSRWLSSCFEINDRVIVKDPRLLWFLPLWVRAGAASGATVDVITMLRHPAEVVRSKSYWYSSMKMEEANRLAGWVNTMLFTERGTRNQRRVYVPFDDLLDDWTQVIGHISETFELPDLVNARAQQQAAADALIDRTLHRSRASLDDLSAPEELKQLADSVWQDLQYLTEEVMTPDVYLRLDKHRDKYVSLYHDAETMAEASVLAGVRPLRRRVTNQRTRIEQLKIELQRATDERDQAMAKSDALKKQNDALQEKIDAITRPAHHLPPVREKAIVVRLARLVPGSVRQRVPHRLRRIVLDPFRK